MKRSDSLLRSKKDAGVKPLHEIVSIMANRRILSFWAGTEPKSDYCGWLS